MKNIRVLKIFALITIIILSLLSFLCSVSAGSVTTNYAVTPTDWRVGETWNAPTYVDNNVLHNGDPSIRMEKGADATKSREILDGTQNLNWAIYAKPGDHIVFSVWMKTSTSTIGDTSSTAGVRLGIDMYDNNNRICGIQTPDGLENPADWELNFVNWGHDWEQRTMSFTIPYQYAADGVLGYPKGQMVTPTQMIPWIQVWSMNTGNLDNGVAWFADAQLYINP